MVENGAELIVDRFQIGLGQRPSMTIGQLPYFVLPVDDVLGCDLRELSIPKIREDFLLNDALFGKPCVQFELWLHVFLVQRHEALKAHVDVRLFLHQELPFPCLCLLLGSKATLQFLLPGSLPIGVAKLHIPCTVVPVLKCCHKSALLSFLGSVELFIEKLSVHATGNCNAAGLCQLFI